MTCETAKLLEDARLEARELPSADEEDAAAPELELEELLSSLLEASVHPAIPSPTARPTAVTTRIKHHLSDEKRA